LIILGIDPGLRTTGYGVIEETSGRLKLVEAGTIVTEASSNISDRLRLIHDAIVELLKERKPEVIALEKLYSDYRHPTTAILMGHARGVICLAAGLFRIPLTNIPSTRVKKSVISHGHASKDQVARAVQGILGLKQPPKPHDVTDALAVAISYAFTHKQSAHGVYA
jgi:crossover junction endodeoxyribonuclease RuvC